MRRSQYSVWEGVGVGLILGDSFRVRAGGTQLEVLVRSVGAGSSSSSNSSVTPSCAVRRTRQPQVQEPPSIALAAVSRMPAQ